MRRRAARPGAAASHGDATGSRGWVAVVLLCLSVAACAAPTTEPESPAEDASPTRPHRPAADTPTVEQYVDASHDACELYLGGLFSMVKADDEVDSSREDASREFFLRRAGDIARLYAAYRSEVAALDLPADDQTRDAHAGIVRLMGENREAIEAVAHAHERGDVEQAMALTAESQRIDEDIAARHATLGVRPCGQ